MEKNARREKKDLGLVKEEEKQILGVRRKENIRVEYSFPESKWLKTCRLSQLQFASNGRYLINHNKGACVCVKMV